MFFAAGGVEEVVLADGGGAEGAGFDDVGLPGGEEAVVDVADDFGPGEGEDVVVVFEVFGVGACVSKAFATVVFFLQSEALDVGAHGAVEDEDAPGGFVAEEGLPCKRCRHAADCSGKGLKVQGGSVFP